MKDQKTKVNIKPYLKEIYRGNAIYFILAMIPTIIDVVLYLFIAWMMQVFFDFIAGVDVGLSITDFVVFSLVGIGISVLSSGITYISKPIFQAKGISQFKNYVFSELTKKNISAFTKENSSSYISSLTNDINTISQGYLVSIFSLVGSLLLFVASLVMMIYYSPILTLVAILLTLLPITVSILVGNKVAKQEKNISVLNEQYTATIKDVLSGFTIIKSFKSEKEMIKLFINETKKLANAETKKDKLNTVVNLLAGIAGIVAQFGVFIFAGYLAISGKGITSGIVIMFTQMMNYLISPVQTIPTCIAQRKSAKALVEKIALLLESNVREENEATHMQISSSIKVENLSFSYTDEKKALDNINCEFELGKKYAIVGASGSGKSTLLNLLMSSYNNYEGSVFYDDTELKKINSTDLYEMQSIIQQNVFVFNATIRDNITMFKQFPEEDVENAIKLSGLSELIAQRGNDYLCGENGNALSGGEKQRISIARSLLKKSQVLLVDEATASLDKETAHQVSSSILNLDGITVIEVTHTLSEPLLSKYDEILTLKNGSLIENGSFSELMDKKGYFYSLFTVSQ